MQIPTFNPNRRLGRRHNGGVRWTIVLGLFLLSGTIGCRNAPPVNESQPLKRYEYKQIHLGTAVRLVFFALDETTARRAADAAFVRIKAIDDAVDASRRGTELRKLCDRAGSDPVPIGDDLFTLIKHGLALARATNGAYDITDPPIQRLWLEARDRMRLPTDEAIRETLQRVGWQKVELDADARTARLPAEDMCLDLSGLARGYAADEAHAILREEGIDQALVDAAPVYAAGEAPEGYEGWPLPLRYAATATDTTTHAAVSSAGEVLASDTFDGERYAQVADPQTGFGLRHFAAATVVAPTGLSAQSLATAVVRLPPGERDAFIAAHPEARFYVTTDNEGESVRE